MSTYRKTRNPNRRRTAVLITALLASPFAMAATPGRAQPAASSSHAEVLARLAATPGCARFGASLHDPAVAARLRPGAGYTLFVPADAVMASQASPGAVPERRVDARAWVVPGNYTLHRIRTAMDAEDASLPVLHGPGLVLATAADGALRVVGPGGITAMLDRAPQQVGADTVYWLSPPSTAMHLASSVQACGH